MDGLEEDDEECSVEGESHVEETFVPPEKVVAPFLRTLKKRKKIQADVVREELKEFYLRANPFELLSKLEDSFTDPLKMATLLNETAELLRTVTSSKSVNLYLTDYDQNEIVLCPRFLQKNERFYVRYNIAPGRTLAAYVAHAKEYVITSDIFGDSRFPEGIPGTDTTINAALCVPVLSNSDGKCIAVVELYRDFRQPTYDTVNLQICTALCGWVGIAIQQNASRLSTTKDLEIHRYLLSITQLLCEDIITFDKAISDVIVFSKAAVKADNCGFYLMDQPVTFGSVKTIFADVYEEALDDSKGLAVYKKKTKTCFPYLKPGTVGYSARSGDVLLIKDAYKDPRFDPSAEAANYRTRSLLIFPIKNVRGVIGVLRLSNKLTGPFFVEDDVSVLKVFGGYTALLCEYEHHNRMNKQKELKLEIVRDLLYLHTKAPVEEFNALKALPVLNNQQMPQGFFRFDWNGDLYEDEITKYILFVFLGSEVVPPKLQHANLVSFSLSVKKAYRPLPYHNFSHAFTVFHFLYNVVNRNKDKFSGIEIVSLLIAGLCHGLDHSGVTNSFLELKNDPIAQLHDDFPQEEHHFQVCLFLIEANDLLSEFTEEEYHEITQEIHRLILSKNLAFFFRRKRELVTLLNAVLFEWDNPDHRDLMKGFLMICGEFSWNFRTFDFIRKHTENYYKELYVQGDKERTMGLTPISMMDRTHVSLMPDYHLSLLSTVVNPCSEIVSVLFPNCRELTVLCSDGMDKWKELIDMRGLEVWKPEDSCLKFKKSRSARNTIATMGSTVSSAKSF